MALSTKSIKDIADLLGLTPDKLTEAIKSEKEENVEVNVFRIYKSEQDFETDIDPIRKLKYDEGVEVGESKSLKALKEKAGLEFEGKKPDEFIKHFKNKVLEETGKNPDKRVAELESDIEKLRRTHEEELNGKVSEATKLANQLKQIEDEQNLYKIVPGKLSGINREDAIVLIQKNFEFETDETGNRVVKKEGKVIKDKAQRPIKPEDAINEFLATRQYLVVDGQGKPTKEGFPAGKDYKSLRKMSEVRTYLEEKGISEMSMEARKIINEVSKAAIETKEEILMD